MRTGHGSRCQPVRTGFSQGLGGGGGLKTMDTEEREKLARRAETSEKAL